MAICGEAKELVILESESYDRSCGGQETTLETQKDWFICEGEVMWKGWGNSKKERQSDGSWKWQLYVRIVCD